MCQHLTLLVEHDERGFVAQCEHGTLHLVWRRSSLQFHPAEFQRIAHALKGWSTNGEQHITSDACVRLFRQQSGWVQLWLCGVGLNLAPLDVHSLVVMLCAAALQVGQPHAETAPRQQLSQYRPVEAMLNRTGSNN